MTWHGLLNFVDLSEGDTQQLEARHQQWELSHMRRHHVWRSLGRASPRLAARAGAPSSPRRRDRPGKVLQKRPGLALLVCARLFGSSKPTSDEIPGPSEPPAPEIQQTRPSAYKFSGEALSIIGHNRPQESRIPLSITFGLCGDHMWHPARSRVPDPPVDLQPTTPRCGRNRPFRRTETITTVATEKSLLASTSTTASACRDGVLAHA